MTYLFSEIAKVCKGNKKTFEPNALTKALANKKAKKDIIIDDKKLSKNFKRIIGKIPWIIQ